MLPDHAPGAFRATPHGMTPLVWFRQDLRFAGNPACAAASAAGSPGVPFYILSADTGRRLGPRRRDAPAQVLAAAGIKLGEHYPQRLTNHSHATLEALQAFSAVKSGAAGAGQAGGV